jgi:hypothetical protein
LRFPVELHEEESIPGALVRGVRDNVLEHSSIFFEDADLPKRNAGRTLVMPRHGLERLANFLGCDLDSLTCRAGTISSLGPRASSIHFGDLALERADVELTRRRVAPITLGRISFHHEAWLFSLLPYCPVSLERLVDGCSACGASIGWTKCWGIGVCEWCNVPIAPSSEAPLPEDHAPDFRFFSSLLSPRRHVRQAAVQELPPPFHEISTGLIVTMALRLGQFCRDEPVTSVRRESLKRLDPILLASVITTGTAMIRNWPEAVRGWARDSFARRMDDLEGFHQTRFQIRRLADPKLEHPTQIRMIREALPTEFGAFASSAALGRFITATELKRRTSVKQDRMGFIRDSLEDRRLPGLVRVRSQFNVQLVDEFEERYRTSIRLRRITRAMTLPAYAIEQMVCLDVIPMERDDAVRQARYGMCVQRKSVEDLHAQIRRRAAASQVPPDALPLETAARQIGGREKPWGAIFTALIRGEIRFWLQKGEVTSRTILVQPSTLGWFNDIVFDASGYSFSFSDTINRSDTEEILNIPPKYITLLVSGGLLMFSGGTSEKCIAREDVLRLARQMVSPAELGFAMGRHPKNASATASKMGVRPIGCGWSRDDLTQLRIIGSIETRATLKSQLLPSCKK